MQRIGDGADVRYDDGLITAELKSKFDLDGELREVGELRKSQRARRQRSRIVTDIVQHRLPHLRGREVEPSGIADGGQAGGDLA